MYQRHLLHQRKSKVHDIYTLDEYEQTSHDVSFHFIATPSSPSAAEQKDEENEEEEDEESSSSESEEEFPDTQLAPVQQPKQEADEAANEEWKKYDLEQHGYDPDADKLPSFAQSGAAADKKVYE